MQTLEIDARRRQDAYDLRGQIHSDSDNEYSHLDSHADAANYVGTDDEEHSVMEEDSDQGDQDDDFIDDMDDGSSSLSIPNESIDFDLVYSLHSFAATVEGQANVVKGDSLFLMDDSNSYWWLVRVLKTQEVGYIPAENIETPFERLARLNKHRNVDLAAPNQGELQGDLAASQDRFRQNMNSRQGRPPSPSTLANNRRSVDFRISKRFHRYPPAIWREEEEDEDEDIEWEEGEYDSDDADLAAEAEERSRIDAGSRAGSTMDVDDRDPEFDERTSGVRWATTEEPRVNQGGAQSPSGAGPNVPVVLRPGEQRALDQQQQQQVNMHMQQRSQDIISPVQTQPPVNLSEAQPSSVRERTSPMDQSPISPASSVSRRIDPLDQQETVRVTMTPSIARESEEASSYNSNAIAQAQRQEEERKRLREEESEESLRKKARGKEPQKMAPPVSSAGISSNNSGGRKLQKQPDTSAADDDSKDKKKRGILGGLFGRRSKDKDKKDGKSSISSVEDVRVSEDSRSSHGRTSSSSGPDASLGTSPTTQIAMQQQQQSQMNALRNSMDPRRAGGTSVGPSSSPANIPTQNSSQSVSSSQSSSPPSISQLRQRDQQQQALYQQYLNRSPSTAPDPNYGLQSASAMTYNHGVGLGPPTQRPRPGSLILTPNSMDGGQLPELSVIRVFAGNHLSSLTEATFKTVLLNSSTTAADLVKQAIQRFRLPVEDGEDGGVSEYYLTIKQVEGSSAAIRNEEKPLEVFESLVQAAMDEKFLMPKVKRSSVGSISSVSSNLSMHPAIKKLPMNDFTDDSAVKFYLNRRSADGRDSALDDMVEEEGDTLVAAADSSMGSIGSLGSLDSGGSRPQYLTVSTSGVHNVQVDRFHSPSFRFAVQVVIYAEDLPEDMIFDPQSEAIVFKDTLRDRDSRSLSISSNLSGLSNNMRRKVFVFPKNVTVAEVIEIGLERFGILEGVVDGGDEVEDKLAKRRSSGRVRYVLMVEGGASSHSESPSCYLLGSENSSSPILSSIAERELSPSSKVLEAYSRPPAFRPANTHSTTSKRRSMDSAQLLGSMDDVSPEDPLFILRRATSYRNTTSRKRMSAPLDELALRNLHRESASSASSADQVATNASASGAPTGSDQRSRKEIIAAQREAFRANQRAILSTQTNSVRGVDVLLPGNARLRSARYDHDDRMRYSYVEPDGETYDISEIVEEEFKAGDRTDILEGVGAGLGKKDFSVNEKLDRVLDRVKNGRPLQQQRVETPLTASSTGSHRKSLSSSSAYSADETVEGHAATSGSRSTTPLVSQNVPRSSPSMAERAVSPTTRSRSNTPGSAGASMTARMFSPSERVVSPSSTIGRSSPALDELSSGFMRPGTITPTGSGAIRPSSARRNPSSASAISDMSGYITANSNPYSASSAGHSGAATPVPKVSPKQLNIPGAKGDFGVSHMMAVIEYRALAGKPKVGIAERSDPVEEMLFGKKLDLDALHPKIRDVYAASFKEMEEMDKLLDQHLQQARATSS
ncbi:hypothetical protein K435DRAFT_961099 [Dendrothele bispora CBS 962.96]|uniref:SH3 domain-containing protein n=1 Tax=Dendrothele bispora (strain CBS 962.96) TaxID=1314807 RepID=A0A4V4HI84_DENBC|nr:hypothetical protein K435DRAFT_961099 [Dendrothele bispora CBS 962.96]